MDDSARDHAEQRIESARQIYERHGTVFRALWIVVATIIVLGGLALTVLPGPATVVVPFGLVMLAVVFGWARKLLLDGVDQGSDAVRAFRDAGTPVQALTVAAVACLIAGLAAWILL